MSFIFHAVLVVGFSSLLLMAGVAVGGWLAMNWCRGERDNVKRAIHEDLSALRATHHLADAAWDTRRLLYDAANDAKNGGAGA